MSLSYVRTFQCRASVDLAAPSNDQSNDEMKKERQKFVNYNFNKIKSHHTNFPFFIILALIARGLCFQTIPVSFEFESIFKLYLVRSQFYPKLPLGSTSQYFYVLIKAYPDQQYPKPLSTFNIETLYLPFWAFKLQAIP